MCGRFTITSAPKALQELFGYIEDADFPPRFNIAPSQPIPVVRLFEGRRELVLVRWGLLPSWVKDPRAFSVLSNARGETIREKAAFKAAMKYRRCLIPANGFYEWQARGSGPKQPFYIHPKSGKPMAFAGLWESWMGPNGEELETATIVTTKANETLTPLHDRMPVILPPEAFDLWLDTRKADDKTAEALIAPAPDDLLTAYPVSAAVNRTANDNPSLLERGEVSAPPPKPAPRPRAPRETKDGGQGVLF